jgi:hypothetical protein
MYRKQSKDQTGFALLIFLVVMMGLGGVAGVGLLASKVENVNQAKIDHDYKVLRQAKKALLSYAVDYKVGAIDFYDMGRLPCPDQSFSVSTEGIQSLNCGAKHANAVGYFPWKTLDIDILRDGDGQCLWYVVSGDYKDGSQRANMMNEDSNGLLRIQDENGLLQHGNQPGDRPIAIIIAPGERLQGQTGSLDDSNMEHCKGNYFEENYLESDGIIDYVADHLNAADDIWTYLYGSINSRLDNSNFNDKMVWITKDEYWDAVKAQKDLDAADTASAINTLTREITECLAEYANHGSNVDASPSSALRRWLPSPAQVDLVDYRDDNEYTDQLARSAGRLPRDIDNSQFVANIDGGDADLFAQNTIEECIFNADQQALWQNWKDHFFYVVSKDFQINAPSSNNLLTRCPPATPGACVTSNGNNVAAIVFYAGSVTNAQSRTAPPDADQKNNIANYLEPTNDHDYLDFITATDNDYYSNIGDLAYCLVVDPSDDEKLTVSDCT